MSFQVIAARDPDALDDVRTLRREYTAWLGLPHVREGLETELADLPGQYAPPWGELLVARRADGRPIGCLGLRPLRPPLSCELKHLFVREGGRGEGVGLALVAAATAAAASAGYREVFLDALPTMPNAIAIYERSGFRATAPYWNSPVQEVLYFKKDLRAGERESGKA